MATPTATTSPAVTPPADNPAASDAHSAIGGVQHLAKAGGPNAVAPSDDMAVNAAGEYTPSLHQVRLATRLAGFDPAEITYCARRFLRRGIPAEVKEIVYGRPGGDRCAYCQVRLHKAPPTHGPGRRHHDRIPGDHRTVDHVVAVALGGANKAHNMVACCLSCNKNKADMPLLDFVHGTWLKKRRRVVSRFYASRPHLVVAGPKRTGMSNHGVLAGAITAARTAANSFTNAAAATA